MPSVHLLEIMMMVMTMCQGVPISNSLISQGTDIKLELRDEHNTGGQLGFVT